MHWFSFGVALLAAIGIIGVGVMYLFRPRVMTPNFGLPLPEAGPNIVWWLRLKGSRDIGLRTGGDGPHGMGAAHICSA